MIGARPISGADEREAGTGGAVTVVRDPADADDDASAGRGVGEGEIDLAPEDEGAVDAPDFDAGPRGASVRPDASALPVRSDDDRGGDFGRDGPDRGDDFDRGNDFGRGGSGDAWRPPPETRPRFAYRCRADDECARLRGVCDRGRCVQCRSRSDCPPYSMCTADRVCVRRPPPGG